MISSTFGAPFGGTMRGAHHGLDSDAFSLIRPPNFALGGGSCAGLTVVVALGAPNSPVTCCAEAEPKHAVKAARENNNLKSGRACMRLSQNDGQRDIVWNSETRLINGSHEGCRTKWTAMQCGVGDGQRGSARGEGEFVSHGFHHSPGSFTQASVRLDYH